MTADSNDASPNGTSHPPAATSDQRPGGAGPTGQGAAPQVKQGERPPDARAAQSDVGPAARPGSVPVAQGMHGMRDGKSPHAANHANADATAVKEEEGYRSEDHRQKP